jgi:hypothetical protein
MKTKPIPIRTKPNRMTKEEFIIQWVLARASFREDFSGIHAARTAAEVWDTIQKIK